MIEGRNHSVHLEKNRLFVNDVSLQEHCFYHGHVQGEADSSVSVGICSGISGFLRVRRQVYLIEPLGQTADEEHAVYRWEHLKAPGAGFSSNASVLFDRDQNQEPNPQPEGLFRSRSWVRLLLPGIGNLYVVVDSTEVKQYRDDTRSRILGVVNHIDKLYRSVNIRIMLVGLEIWPYKDLVVVDGDPDRTLENLMVWRQADLLKRAQHDNVQLVTGKDFSDDTVGLANKFAMCTVNSGGVNQDHHSNPLGLASTIAHEMGHSFGMSHDAAGCVCGPAYSNNCVMTEKLNVGGHGFPDFFSDCSIQQLAQFMERAQPSCLDPPGRISTIALGPRCGNGLLDRGEECDCGTECINPCCDASTCRLTEGSQCAHGECCESCQLKVSGSICRTAAGACDLPEYCSGDSADCPEDSFEMNGKPCYSQAPGYCYDGQCPTRAKHCWRLFGEGAKEGPDFCFDLNKRGQEGCGSMFCVGGEEPITGKHAVFNVLGAACRVLVEVDRARNFDMVPNGTTCGDNKVCLSSKCVDVSVFGRREDCAKKCNSNGVCNHKHECHCNPGWAPPHCDIKYADIPKGQTVMIAGVCAGISTLLVVALVIAGLMCCKKSNIRNRHMKKQSPPGKPNPVFQEKAVRDRPEISQPTLMESTSSRVCSPLVVAMTPCRPSPQVRSCLSNQGTKPRPPAVPPVKPSPPRVARFKPPPPPQAKPHFIRPA
uniref:Zinc metalloproteinase-disintegrin-like 2d n=1 Tax=Poecilia reticulata TaxID=8081 RepID=A0A3P9PDT3_POERE